MIFYERVLKEYPQTEYARDLMMSVGFARSLKEAKLRPVDSVTLKNQQPEPQDSSVQTTRLTVRPQPQPRDSVRNRFDEPPNEIIKQNGFNFPNLPKDLKSLTPDVKINLPFDAKLPDIELPDFKPNSNDTMKVKKP